ncbi:MAG: hypothetical protein GW848_04825 [Rhodoferax sp.]|nr:hypothetical protein [Rhodoferax sp.]OIP20772.1 MAG: hypothetical protein AUK52_10160 [Comamonadaceae bacterium CG2_30_60_41]PIW06919.1 MAG: hypothetical protein COW39_15305 [Comamonadaceae bacterium CG17_big_fil_post_rev_8_21_14_2_50_60_13]PIY26881.1 MAG: hypothetical protein COZ10_01350 [Comamonadaceae bacterium CG_4_10_14_3_um_filter_60_75]PJC19243.1 MAG: hypothetical protein CO066_00810 [Comamonadaceae bacterium CG_4_9_14_0_8_um_filter_60_18]
MKHLALIEKTQSLIAAGDIVGAESALVELADQQGDGALVEALAQLPPKDVLAVIREYDDSKASIINMMLTPEQFARAVVIEKQYRDLTRSHLRGMMNAVIFRAGGDPLAFLTTIGDLEGGSEALADYFEEKWSRVEAFARTGTFDAADDDGEIVPEDDLRANAWARPRLEHDEVADQDWMEMAWLLRYEMPDLFIEMLVVLRAKARAFELGLDADDVEPDDGKVETRDTDLGTVTPVVLDSDEESAI